MSYWIIENILYENITINCTLWVCPYMDQVIFCWHSLSEPKAAIIARNISQVIIWCHAKIYSFCHFSFSDTWGDILRMKHFKNYAKWYLSLLSTRDLLSKQRQLVQCCVQRFTLLEAIVDEQMTNEYLFLSLELKYGRSLIEIIKRLKSMPPRNAFHTYTFNFLDSKYNMNDGQFQ